LNKSTVRTVFNTVIILSSKQVLFNCKECLTYISRDVDQTIAATCAGAVSTGEKSLASRIIFFLTYEHGQFFFTPCINIFGTCRGVAKLFCIPTQSSAIGPIVPMRYMAIFYVTVLSKLGFQMKHLI